MRELQPCGTRAAYQRHKRHGEEADEACLQANNAQTPKQKADYARARQCALENLASAEPKEFPALLKAARDAGRPDGVTKRQWTTRTRQRALRNLANNHPKSFAALLTTERARIEEEAANA
jgi:hypothetical protein